MKRLTALFLSTTLFILSLSAQKAEGDVVNKGDAMPSFVLSSTEYGNIDSKDLKGKVVLITIFATWCGPCQKELAEVESILWPKYKDNPNFKMLVVGREHTEDELIKYNTRKKFTFPLYPDAKREFSNKFATKYIPRAYLVDKNGMIIYDSSGFKPEEFDQLLELIDKLTKE
ncbi:TlpA family protein disulfide reductase [Dysgonomonas sp. ZJ279]|uniref:TlpA family protein disulfide reductase n=1 Tax=Dysgonomonas sp. ZJ279 TaxID=2709796 RepID=UPI0013EBB96E|nr:TlpA disulfide reductase family protein [Dysgonomonas sp. ZJ279]